VSTQEIDFTAGTDSHPIIVRSALRWGWFALGLQLGPTRSDRLVLGWEPRRSSPNVALLSASSRLGLPAELLFKRQQQALLFATFAQQENQDRTPSMGRSRARTSTRRATPPRAGQPQAGEKERDG
jgi:hypothetical protein